MFNVTRDARRDVYYAKLKRCDTKKCIYNYYNIIFTSMQGLFALKNKFLGNVSDLGSFVSERTESAIKKQVF